LEIDPGTEKKRKGFFLREKRKALYRAHGDEAQLVRKELFTSSLLSLFPSTSTMLKVTFCEVLPNGFSL
jgi:hypothetical protein